MNPNPLGQNGYLLFIINEKKTAAAAAAAARRRRGPRHSSHYASWSEAPLAPSCGSAVRRPFGPIEIKYLLCTIPNHTGLFDTHYLGSWAQHGEPHGCPHCTAPGDEGAQTVDGLRGLLGLRGVNLGNGNCRSMNAGGIALDSLLDSTSPDPHNPVDSPPHAANPPGRRELGLASAADDDRPLVCRKRSRATGLLWERFVIIRTLYRKGAIFGQLRITKIEQKSGRSKGDKHRIGR